MDAQRCVTEVLTVGGPVNSEMQVAVLKSYNGDGKRSDQEREENDRTNAL